MTLGSDQVPKKSVDYERSDWDFWTVTKIGAAVIGLVIFCYGASGIFLHEFSRHGGPPRVSPYPFDLPASLPPKPRLQVNEATDLANLHAQEDAILNSYGWIDRDHGIVHIPIQQAIDLLATEKK